MSAIRVGGDSLVVSAYQHVTGECPVVAIFVNIFLSGLPDGNIDWNSILNPLRYPLIASYSEVRVVMTEVQFVEVKPFVSCCKELVVVYHIPSSIRASGKHYIALCEVGESSNQFTWVWAGKTLPLEQEAVTIKWRKGKVTFTSQVLLKLSDGHEYYLMYCNEDGTILGESRPFRFFTDSDGFSSIDLQSAPSDDAVTISMHRKKAPSTTSSEISLQLHSNNDTMSSEVLSEQRYSDTAGDKVTSKVTQEPEYFSQSVTSTVICKDDNTRESTTSKLPVEGSHAKTDDDLLTASKVITLEVKNLRLGDEMDELQAENTTLKEQIALNTLSNSTVLVNLPKEESRVTMILKKKSTG